MSDLLKGLHKHITGILKIANSSVSYRVRFNRQRRAIADMYDYCLENEWSDEEASQANDWIDELGETMRGGGYQVKKCADVLQSFELKKTTS